MTALPEKAFDIKVSQGQYECTVSQGSIVGIFPRVEWADTEVGSVSLEFVSANLPKGMSLIGTFKPPVVTPECGDLIASGLDIHVSRGLPGEYKCNVRGTAGANVADSNTFVIKVNADPLSPKFDKMF